MPTGTTSRRASESRRIFRGSGLVLRAAYGIFYTPVDQNTWCNQRHNVPYVFPETQQADNFTPPAALFANGLNFGTPVLGTGTLPATTVSFTAFDPHSPAQYVQQWNAQCRKNFRRRTLRWKSATSAPRGFHLQRSHLINNAPPGPGPLGPRRPFKTLTFVPGTVFTPSSTDAVIQSQTFPVSTINLARRHRAELVRRGLRERAQKVFARAQLAGELHVLPRT